MAHGGLATSPLMFLNETRGEQGWLRCFPEPARLFLRALLQLGVDSHPVERPVDEEESGGEEHHGEHLGQTMLAVLGHLHRQLDGEEAGQEVVNLITGFMATDEVSLKGSPTVSPTTAAAWRGVPFSLSSTSTIFFRLFEAPPALAMKMAW